MKKLKIIFFSTVLVLGAVCAACAITLTDVTNFSATGTIPAEDYVSYGWGDVNFLSSPQEYPQSYDYVAWEHKFTFNPSAVEIQSGTLKLFLRNNVNTAAFLPEPSQHAFSWLENSYWNIGQVDTGTYTSDVNVNFLSDGVFQVRIAAGGGDFYIDKSELTINYTAVPEPATILLLGFSLVGVAGIRRKIQR